MDKRLSERNLPPLFVLSDGRKVETMENWAERREEILKLYRECIYGYSPEAPEKVEAEIISSTDLYAGKAVQKHINLSFDTPRGKFSFPFDLIIPSTEKRPPVFLLIAFRPDIPDKYLPAEEILDNGFAIATFNYQDVTPDRQYGGGLAEMYDCTWGKISMWAWAASRVMDYLCTLNDEIDTSRIAVTGHSRLGKTALWCGAQDPRFSLAISNCSGCMGSALTRKKEGETLEIIVNKFPFWFCENIKNIPNEDALPVDQHFLIALSAPRHVYVTSAEKDLWADPLSEFLSAKAASEAFEFFGLNGLTSDETASLNIPYHDGCIGYHVRSFGHMYSRTDWNFHMAYRKKHNI